MNWHKFMGFLVEPILHGTKTTTLRPTTHCVPGQRFEMRTPVGKRDMLFATAKCVNVRPVKVHSNMVVFSDGWAVSGIELSRFATSEGFDSWVSLTGVLANMHGPLPLNLQLITWDDVRPTGFRGFKQQLTLLEAD